MENNSVSNGEYGVLDKLVNSVGNCLADATLSVTEISNILSSSTDMGKLDKEYLKEMLEDAKFAVKVLHNLKFILTDFN